MVIGEGFVNHQEHNAGKESKGQADKNGDLREDRTESHTVSAHVLSAMQPTVPKAKRQSGMPGRGGTQHLGNWLYLGFVTN